MLEDAEKEARWRLVYALESSDGTTLHAIRDGGIVHLRDADLDRALAAAGAKPRA